jgi:hypothetical protein
MVVRLAVLTHNLWNSFDGASIANEHRIFFEVVATEVYGRYSLLVDVGGAQT